MLNPVPSPSAIDGETLKKLLGAAFATLESDLVTAKACIQGASDLLRDWREADARQSGDPSVVHGGLAPWQEKRVAAYVETNIASNIRAGDLARISCLSLGHFFRTFRQSFGDTPQLYITKRRVCRSQSLMLRSGAPLSQIALECGLSDQPHFTRVFRKIVGVTPGLWRRQFASEASQRLSASGR